MSENSRVLGWFMRTLTSVFLVVLALLLAAVAGPAIWMQHNVVAQAGFVELAGPLGSNEAFQEGLSAMATSQATASLDLPPQLNNIAAAVINSAARSIYTDPGYAQAWKDTLKRSHKLTFDAAGNKDIQGDVLVDIAPLVGLISANVGKDIGITVPTPKDVVVSLDQPKVAQLLPKLTMVAGWGGWLAFIAVDLLILGIVVARRRAVTVVLAGLGLAVVALLWVAGSGFVETILAELVVGPEVAQQFGQELSVLARQSWQGGITLTFVTAAVVAVAGVGALIVKGRRTT
ncbi:hypothetical protein AAFM46_13260 [Arthrobacter sp. TMP15]|uniref:hypothetical protein n=1 Tax=Arthrobacter sp. TMP15 TaxID=3140789 RepID=UPI0031BA4753